MNTVISHKFIIQSTYMAQSEEQSIRLPRYKEPSAITSLCLKTPGKHTLSQNILLTGFWICGTSSSHNFSQTYCFLGKTSSIHILGPNILLYSLEGAKIGWTLWPLVRMKWNHFCWSPQFSLITIIVNACTCATRQMTVPVLGCPF